MCRPFTAAELISMREWDKAIDEGKRPDLALFDEARQKEFTKYERKLIAERDKEKRLKYQREWYKRNRERVNELARERRKNNPLKTKLTNEKSNIVRKTKKANERECAKK